MTAIQTKESKKEMMLARNKAIVQMRDGEGIWKARFEEIGEAFGVSIERAAHIYYTTKQKEKQMIQLGVEARDKITGFAGIITARATYLYGCDQYVIIPKVGTDGKLGEGQWFDEGRIEVTGDGINSKDVQGEKPGGIQRDAPPIR